MCDRLAAFVVHPASLVAPYDRCRPQEGVARFAWVGVQGCVQRVVLLMVREAGRVDLRAVVRMCPGATETDLQDAILYLLGARLIARSTAPGSARSEWVTGRGEMYITEAGLRHLAGAHRGQ
jgi:hypothetical protein